MYLELANGEVQSKSAIVKQTLDIRAVGNRTEISRFLRSIWPNSVHKAHVLLQSLVATPKYLWVWLCILFIRHIITFPLTAISTCAY